VSPRRFRILLAVVAPAFVAVFVFDGQPAPVLGVLLLGLSALYLFEKGRTSDG
jgi:hypothetical protein